VPEASSSVVTLRVRFPRTLAPRVDERPQIGSLTALVTPQPRFGSAFATSDPVSSIE
jgi:hypothetical protein